MAGTWIDVLELIDHLLLIPFSLSPFVLTLFIAVKACVVLHVFLIFYLSINCGLSIIDFLIHSLIKTRSI